MLEEDIDDTHLCIKCSSTIVGLENYVQHRKSSCSGKSSSNRAIVQVQVDHPYGTFDFTETPSSFSKTSEEVEKGNKSLSDTYDLPYDLGADVFFQSLELQSSSKLRVTQPTTTISTTSVGTTGASSLTTCGPSVSVSDSIHGSGGKVTTSGSKVLTRKATAALLHHQVVENDDAWIDSTNNSENLMNAVRDLSRHNKCDSLFKLNFQHDSPEQTDEDVDDEDAEDYEPTVPANHTGGKWKPENPLRPILLRNSPAWDDRHQWEMADPSGEDKQVKDVDDFEHDLNPPPSHTKGKWVPGSKVIKLDYKEDVEIEKIYSHQYWCNTCNRKLASKALYERHLRSNLHLRRAKPEQELEQAEVKTLSERMKKPSIYLNSSIYSTELHEESKSPAAQPITTNKKKRQRRKYFTKCETCKTRLPKYRLGKHLISHYHYRRMILNPSKSFDMVIENMHRIIHQAPFQCQPCRFYANTEENFMLHWNSNAHRDLTEGPGRFWCRYCKFECEDNNQMRRHLLGIEHKEVVLAINRSVPILIGKKVTIECMKCKQNFRYNIELRKHAEHCSSNEPLGTASKTYQSIFECQHCEVIVKSKRSLQKHLKIKHKELKYFCSVCKIDFAFLIEVKKHRSTTEHKTNVMAAKNRKSTLKKCRCCGEVLKDLMTLKKHMEKNHPNEKCTCPYCGKAFIISQELGRHVRDKVCQPSTSKSISKSNDFSTISSSSNDFIDKNSSTSIKTENIVKEEELNVDSEKTSSKDKELVCEDCSFSTTLAAELIFHRVLHTVPSTSSNQTKLTCPICSKIFRKHSLRCHLRQHTNEKIFECQHCKLRFSRKHNLKTHIQNIHNPKPENQSNKNDTDDEIPKVNPNFQCDTCGKIFNKKYSLKQHISIHGKRDKRFSCPVGTCIFIGRNDYDLRTHSAIHLNEKIFKCNFKGCEYSGKSNVNLKKHAKIHQPADKEFECTNCDYRTRISGHLKRHLRIHSGEKPYRCPHCNYACNSSENLRKHILTTNKHKGRSLYECKFCTGDDSYQTNFQKYYRSHLVMVHHIEKDLNEYLTF